MNSAKMDQIRTAIAGLRAGETSLADLEALIKRGLSEGSFTRMDARTVLRADTGCTIGGLSRMRAPA